jgi:NAD(P)-dependent dehydrogenase (short-subunit alcohol dehydrogenase family)
MPTASAPLADKVVLVTGAARRIGAILAAAFHAQGAKLAVHYRRSAGEAEALVARLNGASGGSARAYRADLADMAALEALPAAVARDFGRIDVLVNNASTFYPTPLGSITPDQFDDLLGSNTHPEHRGHSRHAAAVASRRLQRGQGGPRDADAFARARARPRDSRQCHRAGRGTVARGRCR